VKNKKEKNRQVQRLGFLLPSLISEIFKYFVQVKSVLAKGFLKIGVRSIITLIMTLNDPSSQKISQKISALIL